MRILFIGDIVGKEGVSLVRSHLKSIRKLKGVDCCIVNGENAANGKGISRGIANELLDCGVDAITMGNHTFNKADIIDLLYDDYPIVRPANMPGGAPGSGCITVDCGDIMVCVINASGRIYLDSNMDNPFKVVDGLVNRMRDKTPVILVDFHAEATSEKLAMGRFLDGRVSAVVGTHTHIPTADEQILPGGTAYITDVGMTGTQNGILGVKQDIIINRFLTAMPERFELAEGNAEMHSVLIDVDEYTGKASSIERMAIKNGD